jgi:hypothetical protein
MRGIVAWAWCLAGCDGVFGLDYIYTRQDARTADASNCSMPTGTMMTKTFGGLTDPGIADTFLSSDATHQLMNFGGVDKLFVCYQCNCAADCESIAGDDDDVVALLRFDFATEIPVCSRVVAAVLQLDTTADEIGAGSSVAVYEVLEAWLEGTGPATGAVGAASWLQRVPGVAWTDDGVGPVGSRGGGQIGSFAPRLADTSYDVPLDTETVQGWVDDPATNQGVVLVVMGSTSDVHFHSRETADASKRPALTVTYVSP